MELLIPADGVPPAEMVGMASEIPTREAIDALTRTADIRNTARDLTQSQELNAGLHDEKNIDAEKLYSDAQRAREQMLANREMALARESGGMDDAALTAPNTQTTSTEVPPERMHRGPSVVSYSLPGRSARAIPVPAYQCEGGGMVVVIIGVDPQGYVTRVAVDAERSSHDPCLQQAALAAARGSLFSVEAQAPRMSPGSITYLFVAQ